MATPRTRPRRQLPASFTAPSRPASGLTIVDAGWDFLDRELDREMRRVVDAPWVVPPPARKPPPLCKCCNAAGNGAAAILATLDHDLHHKGEDDPDSAWRAIESLRKLCAALYACAEKGVAHSPVPTPPDADAFAELDCDECCRKARYERDELDVWVGTPEISD